MSVEICLISTITILRADLEITRSLWNLTCLDLSASIYHKTSPPLGQTRIYNSLKLQRTIKSSIWQTRHCEPAPVRCARTLASEQKVVFVQWTYDWRSKPRPADVSITVTSRPVLKKTNKQRPEKRTHQRTNSTDRREGFHTKSLYSGSFSFCSDKARNTLFVSRYSALNLMLRLQGNMTRFGEMTGLWSLKYSYSWRDSPGFCHLMCSLLI